MRTVFTVTTTQREELVDITGPIRKIVGEADHSSELCCLFVPGATAAIMIQENWDPNIPADVIACLDRLVPKGVWLHDRIDGNGDAHIKAGIIGPSEVIPVEDSRLVLSTWQNIFFCEFDGPRAKREVLITLV